MYNLKSRFEKYKKSDNAKKVVSNFSYLTILQIGGYVFPLITYPYLARVICVSGFGKIAFAMSIIIYITTFIDWGYNFTATRDVAKNINNKQKINEIYSNVMTGKIILTIIAIFILTLFIIFIPYFQENFLIITLSFTIVFGQVLFPEWLFQGLENMRLITVLNILSKFLFTIAVFLFIKKPSDYIYQPLLYGCGYVLSGIISLYIVNKKLDIKFRLASISATIDCIKRSSSVFINNLMPNLYTSFSVLLLGIYGGSIPNGYLDGANKFYSIGSQFLTVLSRAFFPFLSRRIDKHTLYVYIKMSFTLVISVVLIIFAPLLVHVFLDDSFENSILPLRILAISLVFHSITNIYGTNYLIIIGKENELRNITIIISAIAFLIAIPAIYCYSYIGATCTIAFARMVLGSCVYLAAKCNMKKTKIKQ
ncbi:MAG: oligosaccharide flippase family protein [Muribaculum sp.]|nr:oligosaccharide flippase family protein [Muribaculum sp.]